MSISQSVFSIKAEGHKPNYSWESPESLLYYLLTKNLIFKTKRKIIHLILKTNSLHATTIVACNLHISSIITNPQAIFKAIDFNGYNEIFKLCYHFDLQSEVSKVPSIETKLS